MQSSEFTPSMNGKKFPVILVEGVSALPEADRAIVVACEVWLARIFPFRMLGSSLSMPLIP
ncbi:MAG: hypothetical protein Q7U64_10345 [Desulfocapsaceae bacterium]|nr:hypothetical protein [Desulfocapsaceae bacterium]